MWERTRRPCSGMGVPLGGAGSKKRTWTSLNRVSSCWVRFGRACQGVWERQRICFKEITSEVKKWEGGIKRNPGKRTCHDGINPVQ